MACVAVRRPEEPGKRATEASLPGKALDCQPVAGASPVVTDALRGPPKIDAETDP